MLKLMMIRLFLFLQVALSISQKNQPDPVNTTVMPNHSQLSNDAGRHLVPERWLINRV
jgi:hypothetical protein